MPAEWFKNIFKLKINALFMFKIFIDESGDLGETGSGYFVLTALVTKNEDSFKRIIKNMRKNKFKKDLSGAMELRANKSSKEIIEYFLTKANTVMETELLHVVINKKKTYSKYLKNDKHKYYNFIAGKLAQNLCNYKDIIEIRIDKSKGKQLHRMDFNEYFCKKLSQKIPIHHSYSHNYYCLQAADFYAWACFQKFEYNNPKYLELVKHKQQFFEEW